MTISRKLTIDDFSPGDVSVLPASDFARLCFAVAPGDGSRKLVKLFDSDDLLIRGFWRDPCA